MCCKSCLMSICYCQHDNPERVTHIPWKNGSTVSCPASLGRKRMCPAHAPALVGHRCQDPWTPCRLFSGCCPLRTWPSTFCATCLVNCAIPWSSSGMWPTGFTHVMMPALPRFRSQSPSVSFLVFALVHTMSSGASSRG